MEVVMFLLSPLIVERTNAVVISYLNSTLTKPGIYSSHHKNLCERFWFMAIFAFLLGKALVCTRLAGKHKCLFSAPEAMLGSMTSQIYSHRNHEAPIRPMIRLVRWNLTSSFGCIQSHSNPLLLETGLYQLNCVVPQTSTPTVYLSLTSTTVKPSLLRFFVLWAWAPRSCLVFTVKWSALLNIMTSLEKGR